MDTVAIPLMDLAPGNLIYRQLETSLQLFISLSSTMSTGEILMARIRLTEANILLGEMMTQRNTASNGKLRPTPPSSFTQVVNGR